MKASVHKAQRIYVFWIEAENDRRYPVFRSSTYTLLEVPTDYCGMVVRTKESDHVSEPSMRTHTNNAVTALRELHMYLSECKLELAEINNKHLEKFRDWCWKRTMKRPQYRGDQMVAKETANVRLKEVYRYITWAQREQLLPARTIGPRGCGVTSTLPVIGESGLESDETESKMYPKMFKRTGRSSRLGRAQYRATEDDIATLEDYLVKAGDSANLRQTMLIVRIATDTAWRVGSVASLNIRQFTRERLEKAEARYAAAYDVSPPDQKNSYSKDFPMSWAIAYDIANYIENDREEIMRRTRVRRSLTKGHIFLSPATGLPFTGKSLSDRISKLFGKIGTEKGSGLHGLRRYAGTRIAKEEIELRRKLGLSMQREDVVDAISQRLGMNSKTSYQFYVEASAMVTGYSVESEKRDQLEAKDTEIAILRAKLAELERHNSSWR
ncbi:hypothetical protein Q8F57_033185 [Paraburkholderia terrae]|uniref:hypothetical protein n=1 Tax=Paraburkholderia terrae TaxID=311230 RepID=UPI00296AFD0B|nr:hypothetical protein [Paraburkholderia terrae]MDW3657809.1 hypothetical protein [Paraburkholderia terrae]